MCVYYLYNSFVFEFGSFLVFRFQHTWEVYEFPLIHVVAQSGETLDLRVTSPLLTGYLFPRTDEYSSAIYHDAKIEPFSIKIGSRRFKLMTISVPALDTRWYSHPVHSRPSKRNSVAHLLPFPSVRNGNFVNHETIIYDQRSLLFANK